MKCKTFLLAGVILSLLMLNNSDLKAQDTSYRFISPPANMNSIPVWQRNTTQTITWAGGPTGPVKITLMNWCNWPTAIVITASTSNTGSYSWSIPNSLACGVYEIYIQQAIANPTKWKYSRNFAITK